MRVIGDMKHLAPSAEDYPDGVSRFPEVLGLASDKITVVSLRRAVGRPTESESGGRSQRQLIPTLIIHKNAVFRRGLESMLSKSRFFVKESVSSLQHIPDEPLSICILGLEKIGRGIPIELNRLRARNIPVVAIAEECQPREVLTLVEAGVSGYLLVDSITPKILASSLEFVLGRCLILPQGSFDRSDDPVDQNEMIGTSGEVLNVLRSVMSDAPVSLTKKERVVLEFLTKGDPNKVIARELGLSESTVKTHVKRLLARIQAKNRTQAAMWAVRNLGVDNAASQTSGISTSGIG